jgi:mannose-6-phosphate isomerase-like protein (cupin superfamily)
VAEPRVYTAGELYRHVREGGDPALFAGDDGRSRASLVVKDHATPVAEAHDAETDVYLVLEGEAALVLGGRIADEAVTEPGQRRGTSIEGGRAWRIAAGDVAFIPAGVPHLVDARDTRLVYLVVKIVG